MRRRDIYWSLFHKSEKRQIDDLRTDYIEVVYEVVPEKDRAEWMVWRDGFRSWKPLEDFPQLLVSLRQAGQVHGPSVPAPAPAASAAAASATNADSAASSKSSASAKPATTVQDRLARQGSLEDSVDFDLIDHEELGDRDMRYQKKWEFRIITTGKPIVNQTIDISNRGVNLKDPLPRGLPRYFNAELVVGKDVIGLVCSELPGKNGAPSSRVRIEVNHQPNVLQSALISHD